MAGVSMPSLARSAKRLHSSGAQAWHISAHLRHRRKQSAMLLLPMQVVPAHFSQAVGQSGQAVRQESFVCAMTTPFCSSPIVSVRPGAASKVKSHRELGPQIGWPSPADRSVASSTPRPLQHAANRPSTTTAGTLRIPSAFARLATSMLFISWTITSQEGHAAALTISIVSWHAPQPALNTSILRLFAIFDPELFLLVEATVWSALQSQACTVKAQLLKNQVPLLEASARRPAPGGRYSRGKQTLRAHPAAPGRSAGSCSMAS